MLSPLPDWVQSYVGIQYADCDCWTLARRVLMEQFDVFLPSDSAVALESCASLFRKVERPQLGDLVMMRVERRAHVGVMLDGLRMLHSSRGKNVCVERTSAWKYKVTGYYRFSG